MPLSTSGFRKEGISHAGQFSCLSICRNSMSLLEDDFMTNLVKQEKWSVRTNNFSKMILWGMEKWPSFSNFSSNNFLPTTTGITKSLILPKTHILEISFLTKFTFSKSHFNKIHILEISFLTKFTSKSISEFWSAT